MSRCVWDFMSIDNRETHTWLSIRITKGEQGLGVGGEG